MKLIVDIGTANFNTVKSMQYVLDNRAFLYALFISLGAHMVGLAFLSFWKQPVPRILYKPIEITYKKSERFKVSPSPKFKAPMKLDQKIKMNSGLEIHSTVNPLTGRPFPDISKIPEKLGLNREKMMNIKPLDSKKMISIPSLEPEKGTYPQLISYSRQIRKIIGDYLHPLYIQSSAFETGVVALTFVISSDGILQSVQVIEGRTQATAFLRDLAVQGLRENSPFPPFPSVVKLPQATFNVEICFKDYE